MKKKPSGNASLAQLCVNTIRMLSIDAIQKADSGHPGLPLGAAPMAYVLWTKFLNHHPAQPNWYNRDRFVLSAGHGSMLLYSLLHLTGYQLSLAQIKQFRQWGSLTPGHPESELTPGVEVTTGPLGQGFANGVGMAIAQAHLAARYHRPGFKLFDHFTYGIVSDGDLMEGVAAEAASLAGHLKLGKLIYLYDNNHITLSAATSLTFTEDCAKRFAAYGWHTLIINDGNDLTAIEQAITKARQETGRPSLILVNTTIGYGSPHKQGTFEAHGSPLGVQEVKLTKQFFDWPQTPLFYIPKKALSHFRKALVKGQKLTANWQSQLTAYAKKYPKLAAEIQRLMHNNLPKQWDLNIPIFAADSKGLATREASGKVMQAISATLPGLLGGSADLNPSTKTELINFGNFQMPNSPIQDSQGALDGGCNYQGRNIFYGVREHAMSAISSGISTFAGLIPFAATFLIFSDYLRPTLRLAALMQRKVIYVFTHDSIGLGEDGPTHQPIEQLASLRAIPGLVVIRPADANETAVAWRLAIEMPAQPIALILTRQALPTLDRKQYAPAQNLKKGAYILADPPKGKPQLILIATGSEVTLIVAAQQKLQQQKIAVRIVSMPSWELFEAQSAQYRETVLPKSVPLRIAVEAGVGQGWERYVGDAGKIMAIDKFGASAPGEMVMQKYGFSVDNICRQVKKLLKNNKIKNKK